MEEYGILSIIPPVVAIGLCIWTRQVILSLFIGAVVGGIIFVGGNPITGVIQALNWMVLQLTDSWNAMFFLMIFLMGSGAAFVFKLGGAHAIAEAASKRIKSPKGAQLFAWIMGMVNFYNDYASCVVAGNASREITAKYRVSREKLSYVIDSTSAPVATFGPISDWIGYQCSMIAIGFTAAGIVGVGVYSAFLHSIPFNIYCILAFLLVPMMILIGREYGPMKGAESRARTTGKVIADGAIPLSSVETDLGEPNLTKASVWWFILPIVALVGVAIFGFWWTGGGPQAESLMDAFAEGDVASGLAWGALSMTIIGFVIALGWRVFNLRESADIVFGGFRTMLIAAVIMLLAWTIGETCGALGTAPYVVGVTAGLLQGWMLPIIMFLICMFLSFSTGTSWGTMAIMTPIGVPLAYELGGIQLVYVIIGVVFSGAIFGDHTSPISDTTVMSSIFSGSDHIAHVTTQIPYALTAATAAAICYLLVGIIPNPVLVLALGVVLLFLLYYFVFPRIYFRSSRSK